MRKFVLGSLLLLCSFSLPALASDESEAQIRARLAEQFPELSVEGLRPSPIDGLYEVRLGAQLAYVSADGQYLLQGDIYEVATRANLTEASRTLARAASVNSLGESSMIIFGAAQSAHTVTVFTDIDCGYCRKLHRQIADYNEAGIRVRYMFFPRSGPNTESWSKADSVWCAADRNVALTSAKAGEVPAPAAKDCGTTPVAKHYELGQSFGIRGTPAIITATGELIPGYVPPEELLEYLEEG
jgi:thiol:disulfide interchange protein DsbC